MANKDGDRKLASSHCPCRTKPDPENPIPGGRPAEPSGQPSGGVNAHQAWLSFLPMLSMPASQQQQMCRGSSGSRELMPQTRSPWGPCPALRPLNRGCSRLEVVVSVRQAVCRALGGRRMTAGQKVPEGWLSLDHRHRSRGSAK